MVSEDASLACLPDSLSPSPPPALSLPWRARLSFLFSARSLTGRRCLCLSITGHSPTVAERDYPTRLHQVAASDVDALDDLTKRKRAVQDTSHRVAAAARPARSYNGEDD